MKKKIRSKVIYFPLVFLFITNLLILFEDKAFAVPNPPGYVLAKGSGWGSIGVDWQLVSGVTGYYVYRSTDGTNFTKVGTVADPMDGFFVHSGLASSTLYYYRVSSYDATGESNLSTVSIYSQTTSLSPNAPRGLVLTDNRDGTVRIAWDKSAEPNVVGYNIYRGNQSGGTMTKLNTTIITGTTYVDSKISFYIDTYYRVTAIDDKGVESTTNSPEKWIKPKALPPLEIPHVKFDVTNTYFCARCHNTHSSQGKYLLSSQKEQDLCYSCHDGTGSENVTYQEFANYSSRHPVDAGTFTSGTLNCSSCHNAHEDYKNPLYPKILNVNYNGTEVSTGDGVCYGCHGKNSTLVGGDHETAFSTSVHNTNMPDPASGTMIKCSNCHEPHGTPNTNLKVYKEENSCFACHANANTTSGAPDIYDRVNANPDSDTHHDVSDADQLRNGSKIECTNCHNAHGDTSTYTNIDPQNPASTNLWTGTLNDFCFRCHSGTFPSNTQTMPFAPGVSSGTEVLKNIQTAYQTDQHGNGVSSSQIRIDSEMGYARGEVLKCDACHEPHGTQNNYNLKTSVTSKDGTKTKDGLMVYKIADGQYDLRFFCNGCHGTGHMGNQKKFPSNCTSGNCHAHGTSSF